ncbi:hypothetical protein [Massilia sp. X63]|uniref:hypothetical protein n=1 Tax=Massilia sp. X63 TaxID=3237285 RepID=UPI0034DD33B8
MTISLKARPWPPCWQPPLAPTISVRFAKPNTSTLKAVRWPIQLPVPASPSGL